MFKNGKTASLTAAAVKYSLLTADRACVTVSSVEQQQPLAPI
jgi:hypothetical protein